MCVGYVAQPGEGFLDIYHEFIYGIGFDRVQELAYEFLASVAREQTETNPVSADAMETLIEDGDVLLSELVPAAIQRLSDIINFADFARATLGRSHEGPDVPGNILVLCPNHRADFEYGVVDIVSETHRIRHAYDGAVDGETLTIDPEHRLEQTYLQYHRRRISVTGKNNKE